MWAYNMKLNPAKCAFDVSVRKFLGFMVTQRGIEVNSTQIEVVLETPTPSKKKKLQHLKCHLVALGHFIDRFTDKLRHFFIMVSGANTFSWTDECRQTFEVVKHYFTEPLILSNPKSGKKLYIYLVVSDYTISIVLFRHIQDKEQRPVYYVSKVMIDVKTQHSRMEQTTLALKNAT